MGVNTHLNVIEFPCFVSFLLVFKFLLPPSPFLSFLAFKLWLPLFPLRWGQNVILSEQMNP